MDAKELDKDLVGIIKVKNRLAQIDYNDAEYDQVEEELHEKEDDFMDKYGDYLDQALRKVHDLHCPDTEILLPIAYLAKKYSTGNADAIFDVSYDEGVLVDADEYPGKLTRLVLVPGPTRLVLQISPDSREEVWNSEN